MSKGQDRTVFRTADGKWANKRNDADQPTSSHDTQKEAEDQARKNLSNEGGGELTTMGRDGKIRSKDTIINTSLIAISAAKGASAASAAAARGAGLNLAEVDAWAADKAMEAAAAAARAEALAEVATAAVQALQDAPEQPVRSKDKDISSEEAWTEKSNPERQVDL